jgi:hypothetical protein
LSYRILSKGFGLYSASSEVIHVDDESPIAVHETGIAFNIREPNPVHLTIQQIRENYDDQLISIGAWQDIIQGNGAVSKIEVSGMFGAENAPATPFCFDLDKRRLFEMVAATLI